MLLALTVALGAMAQGRRGLYINEVLPDNQNSVVDEYGQHCAWIEFYNSTYAPINLATCYVTTDEKYRNDLQGFKLQTQNIKSDGVVPAIPRGDERTIIAPREHALYWLDGLNDRGVFHLRVTLNPLSSTWIGVFDSDGITLIDQVEVPVLPADVSYALRADGVDDGEASWENANNPTPHAYNHIADFMAQKRRFKEEDPHGFKMAVMAMGVVFSALLVLSIAFWLIGQISKGRRVRSKLKAHDIDAPVRGHELAKVDTAEEIAAIAMALHEHFNAHDNESNVLTINKVKKLYSPWNSKIYSLRETPRR